MKKTKTPGLLIIGAMIILACACQNENSKQKISPAESSSGSTGIAENYDDCITAELKSNSLILTNSCDVDLIVLGKVLMKDFSEAMQGNDKWVWVEFEQKVEKNGSKRVGITDISDYKISDVIEETTEYYVEKQERLK